MEPPATCKNITFPETRWPLVNSLKGEDVNGEQAALESLCAIYWEPLYAYIRSTGLSAEDAEDLTQSFFEKAIKKRLFYAANARKGKLRTFLLRSLKRFLIDEHRKSIALKRKPVSLGETATGIQMVTSEDCPSSQETPDVIFQRKWARKLLSIVFSRLESEWIRRGRHDYYRALKPNIPWNAKGIRNNDLAKELGVSAPQVRKELYRIRRHFHDLLQQEIRATVKSDEEVEEEIRNLRTLFDEGLNGNGSYFR